MGPLTSFSAGEFGFVCSGCARRTLLAEEEDPPRCLRCGRTSPRGVSASGVCVRCLNIEACGDSLQAEHDLLSKLVRGAVPSGTPATLVPSGPDAWEAQERAVCRAGPVPPLGERCVVQSFDPVRGKYTVRLETGEGKRVLPRELRLEGQHLDL